MLAKQYQMGHLKCWKIRGTN